MSNGTITMTGAEYDALAGKIAALEAELAKLPAVLDGFVLVPVEPTPEMVSAAEEAHMPFGDMDIALRMAILSAAPAQATDGLRIGAWRDALEKIAKYAPPVNCAARTEVERIGLIAVHALIAFSAPQFSQPPAHQEANNAAAPQQSAVPDDYLIVPIQPTEEMRKRAQDYLAAEGMIVSDWLVHTVYTEMLAAAPSAPATVQGDADNYRWLREQHNNVNSDIGVYDGANILATPEGDLDLVAALAAPVQGEAVAWARQCDLDESDPAIFVAREEVQESGYLVPLYTTTQPAPAQDGAGLLEWAVDRWHAEVANRPLQNVHRRSLDDTWRQVIRKLGGDAGLLCGPAHDAIAAARKGEGK